MNGESTHSHSLRLLVRGECKQKETVLFPLSFRFHSAVSNKLSADFMNHILSFPNLPFSDSKAYRSRSPFSSLIPRDTEWSATIVSILAIPLTEHTPNHSFPRWVVPIDSNIQLLGPFNVHNPFLESQDTDY